MTDAGHTERNLDASLGLRKRKLDGGTELLTAPKSPKSRKMMMIGNLPFERTMLGKKKILDDFMGAKSQTGRVTDDDERKGSTSLGCNWEDNWENEGGSPGGFMTEDNETHK